MRPRYLLLAGERASELPAGLSHPADLRLRFSGPGVAAFANEHCACLPLAQCGCVLGRLFRRNGQPEPVQSLAPAEASAIVESNGERLLSGFWGGYVAALSAPASTHVMRDPSAGLPSYFAKGRGFVAFASDVELLIESGRAAIELDWTALAAHFYAAGVPTSVTALRGISELLAGFGIHAGSESDAQFPWWSPWDYVERPSQRPADAADHLAGIIKQCVRSSTGGLGRLLLSVSGGLDSSIVAAVLAEAGADAACLTMYGEDPDSDERPFAHGLCDHLGLPLLEHRYRLEDVDIAKPLGRHLPRPTDRTQALAYESAHLETAREVSAAAFVTGNGGDSVFGYSQSAAAIADRYLREGIGRGILQSLRDVSRQTGCSIFEAASAALRIAGGPRGYRCRPETLFLNPEVLASIDDAALVHPWLDPPKNALPGKAAHIASILRMQQHLEPTRAWYLPVIHPLMSQPVIEVCLGVPSWQWRSGGRDRALARRAFAGDLPHLILQRRIKGGPDSFAAKILDHFRVTIRQRLLDGQLARHRIIDRAAIEQELKQDHQGDGEKRARILEFVAAEAWIDSWSSRKVGGAAN